MIGITAAPIIPAKAPRPDITPKAAPNEIAAKLTVNPEVISGINLLKSIVIRFNKMIDNRDSKDELKTESRKKWRC